jgi:transposase
MFCFYNQFMAMGTRKQRQRQESLWYGGELPTAPGHPFYKRLSEVLDEAKFDPFCETSCAGFYHQKLGRPSLPPGQYFRIMMIGFFEGLDSERGIAWRMADSLTLRQFLSIGLDEKTPDHVTISRTRRLIDGETHQQVFSWVLERLAQSGLIKGKTIGVDSTTLEANAAMRSIVRRDIGESYTAYLKRLVSKFRRSRSMTPPWASTRTPNTRSSTDGRADKRPIDHGARSVTALGVVTSVTRLADVSLAVCVNPHEVLTCSAASRSFPHCSW